MAEFRTVERRETLTRISNRWQELQAEFPGLNENRLVNRLHAEGINCDLADVHEALEFAPPGTTDLVIKETYPETMNTKEASAYIGITEENFKAWWPSGSAKPKKTDYISPPEGTPVPERSNESERGKPILYSFESLKAVKRFLEDNQ